MGRGKEEGEGERKKVEWLRRMRDANCECSGEKAPLHILTGKDFLTGCVGRI